MLGKIEGKRRRGQQRMRLLDSITNSVDMNFSKFWEIVKDRGLCAVLNGWRGINREIEIDIYTLLYIK